MNTVVQVTNKTGLTRQVNKTPYELWYGKRPVLEKFTVFGITWFAHISAEKRRKLDKVARKWNLVDYLDDGQGYCVYVPSVRDVILSRDVMFKFEQVSVESVNLSFANNIEHEDMHAQSDEVQTYESAEDGQKTIK